MFYDHVFQLHVYVYLVQTIDYTYTSFEPRAFMHIFLWTRCVWICMYTLVCIKHTYALKYKLFLMKI